MLKNTSTKSIVRISIYRSHLRGLLEAGEQYIFSHDLANGTGYTAAQIRRDLMCVEAEGNTSKEPAEENPGSMPKCFEELQSPLGALNHTMPSERED